MAIEVREAGAGVVVRVRGEAGVAGARALEAALTRLIVWRPPSVTFEFAELRLLSSLAMRALVDFHRAAVRAGCRVGLAPDLHPAVRAALDRAGLMSLFTVVDGARPGAGPKALVEDARHRYPRVDDLQRTCGVTWGQLAELEPELQQLLWRARMEGGPCRTFTDVDRVLRPLRDELAELIGFAGKHRRHPVLSSAGAYAVAYWKLYDAVAGLLRRGGHGAPEKS
jgi:anti-anti-sigma regulatory factor